MNNTKQNDTILTMRENLGAIFSAMKLESVPTIKADVRKNDELYKEIVNKRFSSWKKHAMSKQAKQTVAYFYNLELFSSCIRGVVGDFCNQEDVTEEQAEALESFMRSIASKAVSQIQDGQGINAKINAMMRAYKSNDFEMFSLCFERFFGFVPDESDMEKLEILMLNGSTIRSNASYRKTLCGIFTVLQGGENNFSVKGVKTTFADVTKKIDIFHHDEIFDENEHVRTELLDALTKRYNVKLPAKYDWEKQHKAVLSAVKKNCVFYPAILDDINLKEKLEFTKIK